MSALTIYGYPRSTFVRTARMACVEKGVPYSLDPFRSFGFGSDTHRELHPFGRMPVLRHGDLVLFETSAICHYIDEAFEGPRLSPQKLAERCVMHQWISLINDYVYERLVRRWILPGLCGEGGEGREDDEARRAGSEARETLQIVDGMLEGGDYLVGTAPTTADLFLAPILAYAEKQDREIFQGLDNIGRVWSEISSRDSFVSTMD